MADETSPTLDYLASWQARRDRLDALEDRFAGQASQASLIIGGVSLAVWNHDTGKPALVPRPNPTGDEVLEVLALVPQARGYVDRDERSLIEAARRRGTTWQAIAEALGLRTRQAARQRYKRLGGDLAALDAQIQEGGK